MSSKAIIDPQPQGGPRDEHGRRPPLGDLAPSVLSTDDPSFARFVGMVACVLFIICGAGLAWNSYYADDLKRYHFSGGWLTLGLVLGLVGLLFHAAYDRDVQFRRLYLIFGGTALVVGIFLCILPKHNIGMVFDANYDADVNFRRRIYLGCGCLALIIGGILCRLARPTLGLLFPAALDSDLRRRRLILLGGVATLLLGVALLWLAQPNTADLVATLGYKFQSGFPCMVLALVFVAAALRHEDERPVRDGVQYTLGGVGALFFLVGAVGGMIRGEFLLPYGLLLALLGICYFATFVASRGTSDDKAYYSGWALGGVGLVVFLYAFVRSFGPPLYFALGWSGNERPPEYLIPVGLLLMVPGLVAMFVSVLLCSENRFVVLLRRELTSFFYTPVAYLVIIGFTMVVWLGFCMWFLTTFHSNLPVREPVVGGAILSWPGVLMVMFGVPVLTMRLLSEEKRSGTLEVLMTSPTDEVVVVLSKFVAALLILLLMWVPFGLFILAFRIMGGAPFDYLPLLSFAVGLTVTSAGFVAAGLFFSSLAREQVVGAVLTFVLMMVMTFIYFIKFSLEQFDVPLPNYIKVETVTAVINHISYIDVWNNAISGKLQLAPLLFFCSMTVWFLFLTVRVLEARRWA